MIRTRVEPMSTTSPASPVPLDEDFPRAAIVWFWGMFDPPRSVES
jgi:hypothetical protein